MTDISRMSRRTAAVVRDAVGARPALSLATAGFLAASVTVVAGGRVGLPQSVIPLTNWLGLLPPNGHSSGDAPGAVMVFGVVALLALWLVAIRMHHSRRVSERTVWLVGAAWATPFVVGPPLLSNDVFTYAAQGLMLRRGLDPYSVGPAALGNVRALAAVDPSWRSIPSPYGPLATTLQHLAIAISGGNPLGAALVFRALGVLCLVAIGLLAADLAGPRRIEALTIIVLNPLLLLHIVSAAHLDGAMCVLLLAAVVQANRRHWAVAIVLAVAAGAVKAPAFVAVLAIMAVHIQSLRGAQRWRTAARDTAIAAVSTTIVSVIVRDGWGWIHALNAPALGHTALAPASLLGDLLRPVVPAASFDDLSAGGRVTALIAAGCIVVYLTVTARHRALDRTVGYGMLAVGVLSPVVYPWYLLGGIVCLAPTARAGRRDLVLLLSAIGCLLSPPGFSGGVSTALSVAAGLVALALVVPRMLARRRSASAVPGDASKLTVDG